ncbi:hypothetical protein CYLTODRAFT_459497 [Cylindrobasidium torrendii FP15055 ss-10]|uniref:Uncharacterized protein n=1 Tax=Cylindrobasidium torrendii FP15055 ss-10 TaxID=1314674 RepID=A0A0D7AU15_9AGAR|nr:hypothetical protein CYLTODRAFT_459497 [Cylindrobasidium torrendii FP15055 ss-10]
MRHAADEIAALKRDNKKLAEQSVAGQSVISGFRARMAELSRQMDAMNDFKKESERHQAEQADSISNLNTSVADLKEQLRLVTAERDAAQREVERLISQYADMQKEMQALRESGKTQMLRIAQLQAELDQSESNRAEAEQRANAHQVTIESLQEQQRLARGQEKDAQEQYKAALNAHASENQEAAERLRDAETKLSKAQTDIQNANKDKEQARLDAAKALADAANAKAAADAAAAKAAADAASEIAQAKALADAANAKATANTTKAASENARAKALADAANAKATADAAKAASEVAQAKALADAANAKATFDISKAKADAKAASDAAKARVNAPARDNNMFNDMDFDMDMDKSDMDKSDMDVGRWYYGNSEAPALTRAQVKTLLNGMFKKFAALVVKHAATLGGNASATQKPKRRYQPGSRAYHRETIEDRFADVPDAEANLMRTHARGMFLTLVGRKHLDDFTTYQQANLKDVKAVETGSPFPEHNRTLYLGPDFRKSKWNQCCIDGMTKFLIENGVNDWDGAMPILHHEVLASLLWHWTGVAQKNWKLAYPRIDKVTGKVETAEEALARARATLAGNNAAAMARSRKQQKYNKRFKTAGLQMKKHAPSSPE